MSGSFLFLSASKAVGDGVEEPGGAHPLALVVDDDGGGVEAAPVVTELDLFVAEVDGSFVASAYEAEGVVFLDFSFVFGVEEFVVVFGRGQEAEACEVDVPMESGSIGFMPMAS
jgi:hypothetical protein